MRLRYWLARLTNLWQGSTLQLLSVIILPVTVLAIILAVGGVWLHQQAMRDMVGQRDVMAVRAAAQALEREIQHRQALVATLAQWMESAPDPEVAIDEYASFQRTFDLGIAVYSDDGSLLASRGETSLWQSRIEATATRDTEVITLDEARQRQAILFRGATDGRGLTVVAATSAGSLVQHLTQVLIPLTGKGRVLIFDDDQRIIFRSDRESPLPDLMAHVQLGGEDESGAFYMDSAGVEHVVAYSTIPSLRWTLVIEEPWAEVATPVLEMTRIAPLVLVPLLLIALGGIWFGAQQIVQPLRALEERARRLAWGEFDTQEEDVGGIAEIRRLNAEITHMARKVQTAQRALHDYIGAITSAQEEERRRLARELHDDTLQAIIALKQRVQMARRSMNDAEAQESLRELEEIAEQTIQNLRRTTRALRPTDLEDLGLVTALEMLVQEMSRAGHVEIEFKRSGKQRRLPASVELTLYRIAQEALSNVLRHAQANKAQVLLAFDADGVELDICDDGIGFAPPASPADFASKGHFGLLGIHERADLIGARLSLHTAPGQGTRLHISWQPIDAT